MVLKTPNALTIPFAVDFKFDFFYLLSRADQPAPDRRNPMHFFMYLKTYRFALVCIVSIEPRNR